MAGEVWVSRGDSLRSVVYRVIRGQARGVGPALTRGLLQVLSWGYRGFLMLVERSLQAGWFRPHRLTRPVVSVGNLTWGGTGKTPLAARLASQLAARGGCRPAILTRGYGGDEPSVLRRLAPGVPVLVGASRVATGRRAIRDGADLLILDDGFQHRRLHRDLDIVLVDSRAPFGNGYLLPRGSLREPPYHLRRAHVLVLTKADRTTDVGRLADHLRTLAPRAHIMAARYRPESLVVWPSGEHEPLSILQGLAVAVVSGIADPSSFEGLVTELGAIPVLTRRFLDHHPYTRQDIAEIVVACRRVGVARVITTLKDAVRFPEETWSEMRVAVLHVALEITGEEELLQRILALRHR